MRAKRLPGIVRIYLLAVMFLQFRKSICGGNTTYCHLLPCNEDLPCTPEGGCGDAVNSCDSNPCPWNATCQVSVLTQTYECQCPAGYEGTYCEIPMKRCYRNICKYGGECYVGEGGPTCFCTMGYKGTLCETPEDECLWNPCKNGAVCRNRGNGYACYCVPGFQGPLCDIEVDECASQPCQNGATCLNQIGSYTCVCQPEYIGRDCELEFNECSSGPCLNGGSCHNSQSSFSCSCPSGFSGDLCEHNVDECSSSPCLNGGQCLDKNNGYTCNCSMVGFTGLHCETPLPLCWLQPCQNTATCLEGSGNITCLCGPGVHCEEDINECETNPCQNGGTCENTNGSYICHCAANKDMTGQYYGGRDCQELLIGCEGSTCQNGGSCNPYLIGGKHLYSCLCPAGFTDPDCRTQTTFSFNGKTVLPLGNLIFQNKESPISNISLSFQTVQLSALIFHLGDNTTFLRLLIQDGYIFLFSYVYGHQKTFLHLSHNISDDRWHAVEVIFTDIITLKLLDTACTIRCAQSVTNNITSYLTSFTLDKLFFGGDTPTAPGVYSYFSNTVLQQAGFVGCMRDIRVDSRTITAEGPMLDSIEVGCKRQDHCEYSPCQNRGQCVNLWLGYHCDCYRPYRGNNCSSEYESGRFGHGDASYAIFHLGNKQTDDIDLSAFVRTRQPSGLLLALGNATSYGIVVSLQGGKLVVRNSNDIVLKCEHIINDGQFHLISLKVTQNTMECLVSSRALVRISIAATWVHALSVLYVGGLEDATETLKREGYFKGCIQDLRIGSRKLEFFPDSQSYIVNQILHNVTQGCSSDNLCKSNPCQNGGACYPVWDDFTCTCPPNTTGKACEELKWCEIIQCPPKAVCQPVPNGYECITSVVFRGTGHGIRYMSNGNISRDLTNLTLGFRTGCSESVLLHAEREPEAIMLAVRDSRLVLNLQSGNSLYAVTLAGKEKVSDSQWHNVTISMASPGSQSSRWQMEIDGKTDKIISNVATGNLNFLKERIDIYLGVHNQGKLQNFTGCLGTVVIGGLHLPYFGEKDYQLKKPQIEQFVKTSPGIVSIGCLSSNPCASHPCLNGGNCQDFLTHPVCTCPAGRTGKFCEMEIDECLSNPCLHGNCTDGAGGYTCECQTGYTGTNCDINICHGHMCPSGTTCVEGPVGFFCLCPANVTGPYCRYNRLPSTFCGNEKKNITCYNFSNCTEENGALRCICLAGFVGERCEVDIDECESDPCMNGGLCQNLPNRFLCICDVNYAGEQCEIDQSNSLQPGLFTIVASVVLALFFATCAGICIFIAVASMRSSQGTYSPSRQEKEGSRVEMWNIVQPPPLERLI